MYITYEGARKEEHMEGHILMDMNETITQTYSSSHKAVDVVGAGNGIDDVIAFDGGTVEIVVNTVTGNRKGSRGTASYGNFVKIRHDNGMKTLYAHMEYGSISVKAGEHISKGQKIGRMGDTGNAYGVHLHFEVRQSDETRINPYPYLFEGKQLSILKAKEDVTDENSILTNSNVLNNSLGETEDERITDNSNAVEKKNDIPSETNNIVNNSSEKNIESINPDNNNSISYLSNSNYEHGSIVDGLKSIGTNSSFDYRTLLAYENGIHNYCGSYEQNIYLLNLLKEGKLKKA